MPFYQWLTKLEAFSATSEALGFKIFRGSMPRTPLQFSRLPRSFAPTTHELAVPIQKMLRSPWHVADESKRSSNLISQRLAIAIATSYMRLTTCNAILDKTDNIFLPRSNAMTNQESQLNLWQVAKKINEQLTSCKIYIITLCYRQHRGTSWKKIILVAKPL